MYRGILRGDKRFAYVKYEAAAEPKRRHGKKMAPARAKMENENENRMAVRHVESATTLSIMKG
jgi:hypothetical protein